jgi:hypothetical protein
MRRFTSKPLFLAGHSRGGAAVIWVANLLKRDAIEVDGMFLLDAVDRTASLKSVEKIPGNESSSLMHCATGRWP